MCTGRIDLSFVLRAFQKGADGVIAGGCWPGECHYVTEGNYDALSTMHLCKKVLERIGLNPERIRIEWIAASEGTRFAEIMSSFVKHLKDMGPLGEAEGIDEATLATRLDTATDLVPYIKLVAREKLVAPGRTEEVINTFFASDEANRTFDDLIADKLVADSKPTVPVSSPCQLACPIGTEAWRYIAHIERGEYEQAYRAIRDPNPFPSVCSRVCDHKCEQHCRLAAIGADPVAIRALKRFVTDNIDPSVYTPPRAEAAKTEKVAIVGAGPAGLSAAHLLSIRGYQVTVYDANDKPGGMLLHGIPEYRLPRDVLAREIDALIDDNVTLRLGVTLGKDISVEQLFDEGFDAVFLALGSMKSLPLRIDGEEASGVYPSLRFLGEFNLKGVSLAKGRVGVIGGGNSAIDAARIALRQEGVDQVTIIYRRTREEMPAHEEEIQAAIDEGIVLNTLLSPVSVHTEGGAVVGVQCIKNELGPVDRSGRRRPVPIAGSEQVLPLDTLIVAVGEKPELANISTAEADIKMSSWGSIDVDPRTHTTSRKGLFAGGDVVTGPNTVVDAIAAGKRAAAAIDRYLSSQELLQPGDGARRAWLDMPARVAGQGSADAQNVARLSVPHTLVGERRSTFLEVEHVVDEEVARREAGRCLRCDLELSRSAPVEDVSGDTRSATVEALPAE